MLKKLLIPIISMTGIILSACATQQTSYPNFTPTAIAQNTPTTSFKQKTDTVFVILDSSATVNETFDGNTAGNSKFDVEKHFLSQMNQTIPSDIKLSSGLRSFGLGACIDWGSTKLIQDISRYSRSGFQTSLDQATCASGGSPLESALASAITDLEKASGNIALLILSDGDQISSSVFSEAKSLENKYGSRLCIYSVWVGNKDEQAGQFTLQELSNIAGCGQTTSINNLKSNVQIAAFTEAMLFNKEKTTPKAIILDSDNDGVIDANDKCPNTPKGAHVNTLGCWSFTGVQFNLNKAEIKSGYEAIFDNAIKILKLNPNLMIEIQGHTDSSGSAAYNLQLSIKRAQAVKDLLVRNNISANRLTVKGFGESKPIASNETVAGRNENRRVEYKILSR